MSAKTKYALSAALQELLNHTTLDHITVKDIVDRAHVSRQTFYYHFSDVYDLLEWSFHEAVEELCSVPAESWRDRLLIAVDYLRANRSFVMNVYHSLGLSQVARGLEQAIRPLVRDGLQNLPVGWKIAQIDEEFAVSFFTYGVVGSIIRWLDAGMPEELDRVINDIHNLIHIGKQDDLFLIREGEYNDQKTM